MTTILSGTFYGLIDSAAANVEKQETILSGESLVALNFDQPQGKSYRIELYNLALTHDLPSLRLSPPPDIKDFESEYIKWQKRRESLVGQDYCQCKLMIDNGIYGKYQLLNHGEEFRQLISIDFNNPRFQIGRTQSLTLAVTSPKTWNSGYIQVLGNYSILEQQDNLDPSKLKAITLFVSQNQISLLSNGLEDYLSLNIKNESSDGVKVSVESGIISDNAFFQLDAGQSFSIEKNYKFSARVSIKGTTVATQQVSLVYEQ